MFHLEYPCDIITEGISASYVVMDGLTFSVKYKWIWGLGGPDITIIGELPATEKKYPSEATDHLQFLNLAYDCNERRHFLRNVPLGMEAFTILECEFILQVLVM